jgi:hypothetical protein
MPQAFVELVELSMFQTVEKHKTQGSPSLTRLAAFVAVLTLGSQSPLVIASGLSESVHICTQEPDDAKRLACYDNAAGRAQPRAAAIHHPAQKADETSAASTLTPPKATEISASITHVTRRADGRYVITLDNGQIWLEAETKERLSVNTGDNVTIRTELLGSHYLRTTLGADVLVLRQPGAP